VVVDLAAGGGGPWQTLLPALTRELGARPAVTLTDLHPVSHVTVEGLHPHDHPVDATDVPSTLRGLRTLFDGLHHFPPAGVIAVLRDAVHKGAPIAVGEVVDRSLPKAIAMALVAPLLVLLVTPIIRPRTWWRFLFTYLIPIAPLAVAWDGTISMLRAYTPAELESLSRLADPDGTYTWCTGRNGSTLFLIGAPKRG
jgi:hypothetical protein